MGFRFAPDPRQMRYRMGDYLVHTLNRRTAEEFTVLEHGKILDQGLDGTCVGHAWVAWENCKPRGAARQQGHGVALEWYDRATEIDPWPENDGDRSFGTSTTAGAQVAIEWELGAAYVWAESLDAIKAFINSKQGPVVVGTYWYNSMFDPDEDGFVTVNRASGIAGGHEWLIFGTSEENGVVYHCQNSWGTGWGDEGIFYVREPAMADLIYGGGEACALVQTGILPN